MAKFFAMPRQPRRKAPRCYSYAAAYAAHGITGKALRRALNAAHAAHLAGKPAARPAY